MPWRSGKLRRDVWDLIFANVRLPIVEEDMRAEIGSCVVGERGVLKIVERYGLEVFESHKEHLFDATERMMRQEIRSIPNDPRLLAGQSVSSLHQGANHPFP